MINVLRLAVLVIVVLMLTGCNLVVLDPAGDIAAQQGQLIIYATVLMLIVILPVMALTVFFAFHYRAANKKASYSPDWDHSISLEIVVWSLPLAIIICLAGLTWVATHRLEPYDDLSRVSATKAIDPTVEPLTIQVVALDWKWMFIYPELGIATVNEAASIVDRPVEFKLTSATVMNSFYIPAMAGQIYAMAGMETELNAVLNEAGVYEGFSANYSGAGFSQMRFRFHGLGETEFNEWVAVVRARGTPLNRAAYVDLAQPSIGHEVTYFNEIEEGLWDRVLNLCVEPGTLCMNDMMMVDALGGGGLEGLFNRDIYSGICAADDSRALYYLLRPDLRDESLAIADAASSLTIPDPEQTPAGAQ